MELETIESFLKSIGEERHLDKFLENEIDLEGFKTMSEKHLKALLEEIGLKPGARMKIISKREAVLGNRGTLKKNGFITFIFHPHSALYMLIPFHLSHVYRFIAYNLHISFYKPTKHALFMLCFYQF